MGAGPGSVVGGVVDNLVYKVLAKTEGGMAVKQAKWVAVGAVICLMAASAGGAALHLGGQRVPLELTVLDDESDPVKTVSCMESLAQMGITAYLGGVGSHLHAAAAAVAEKNQIPYCGVGFALWSIHQRGYKYLFSPFPKSPELAVETYPHPQRVRPCSKPAPARGDLRRTHGLGQGTSRPVGDPVSGVRHEVVFRGQYTVGARDMSDLVLRARAAGAELVLAVPTPRDGRPWRREMDDASFGAKVFNMSSIRPPRGGPPVQKPHR